MVVPSERMHEKAPVSPSAPNTLCPCAAICRKIVFSAWTKPAPPASFSQTAQLELTEAAVLALAIADHSSSSV